MAGGRKSALPVIGERAETLWFLPVFCAMKWICFCVLSGGLAALQVSEAHDL